MRRKEKTHYLIVLDQSGSIERIKHTVISLFNEQIQSLKKQSNEMNIEVTMSVFNDAISILNLGAKIGDVQLLNEKNYKPDSMTALYDAVMISYNKMKEGVKKQDRIVALVLTDGLENASKEYNSDDVKKLMDKVERKGGSFNFLCSSVDIGSYQKALSVESNDCISFDIDEVEESLKAKLERVSESILQYNH
tara:strand:+ start:11619 stop:12197 length:579 start_codon:yes stop_codon:yes gene_type:complete